MVPKKQWRCTSKILEMLQRVTPQEISQYQTKTLIWAYWFCLIAYWFVSVSVKTIGHNLLRWFIQAVSRMQQNHAKTWRICWDPLTTSCFYESTAKCVGFVEVNQGAHAHSWIQIRRCWFDGTPDSRGEILVWEKRHHANSTSYIWTRKVK